MMKFTFFINKNGKIWDPHEKRGGINLNAIFSSTRASENRKVSMLALPTITEINLHYQ
jgi:hypothetical protein